MKYINQYLSLILLILPLVTVSAQTFDYRVQGRVTDEAGAAVAGASVQLSDDSSVSVLTDANGNFEISVPTKETDLKIGKTDFFEQQFHVSFSGNENRVTYVNFTLSDTAVELEEVVISDNPSLVTNSKNSIRKELDLIPGGVELVDLNVLRMQPSQTLKDAIGNQPGVIIQEFFGGNDQPRLNIRGSGIQSNPQARGVMILQDGIPVNQTDGSYIIGVIEPQASHLVEVFKGSNALKYGSSTLGGAINFITKNGYNASPLSVKIEAGSFESFNANASSGFVSGRNDGFFSVSYNISDGFRDYNSSKRYNALMNIGRRFNDNFESRLLVNYTNLDFDVAGPLTKAQYLDNPKQVNGQMTPQNIGPNVQVDKPGRAAQVLRMANKSVYKFNNNNLIRSTLYYQYTDDEFIFPIAEGVRSLLSNDGGLNLVYENRTAKNSLTVGADFQFGSTHASYYINKGGEKFGLFSRNNLNASKQMVYINDVYSISPQLMVNAAVQLSHDTRKVDAADDDPASRPVFNWGNGQTNYVPGNQIQNQKFDYTGFNPKLGLIYLPAENIRLFANASRSYEPPTFLEIINLKGGSPVSSPNTIETADLDDQTALTFEIGSSGKLKNNLLSWDVSIYSSQVKNELLALTDINGITGQTINSESKTIHRGIEAGVQSHVLKNMIQSNDFLKLGVSYTYSDFYFKEGTYKDNKIAGIPKHYVIGEIQYENPIGLLLNFNIESLPEKTPIDHHNELYQDPYTLLNARIGFQKKRWGIYAEGRNLSDRVYASSYLVRDATMIPPPMQQQGATKESATNYIPGIGRNFMVGIHYTF